MSWYKSCTYPNFPPEVSSKLFNDKSRIVVGVIGRSIDKDCNKLAAFDILQTIQEIDDLGTRKQNGDLTFYYREKDDVLFIHFKTLFDNELFLSELSRLSTGGQYSYFLSFNSYVRTSFGQYLLFALHICHLIVLTEPRATFDGSYLPLLKSLKIVREKYVLKFLPKLLKGTAASHHLSKEGRLCVPRVVFLFEDELNEMMTSHVSVAEMEEQFEDHIYKLLRHDFIITNNSSMLLFSLPKKRKFVYFYRRGRVGDTAATHKDFPQAHTEDALSMSFDVLSSIVEGKLTEKDVFDAIRPSKGFGCHWTGDNDDDGNVPKIQKQRSFQKLIRGHAKDIVQYGFDEGQGSKYRSTSGRSSHQISMKNWLDSFQVLYKIFIENSSSPDFETADPDYAAYLSNFHEILDIDDKFFEEACQRGFDFALAAYNESLPHHYSAEIHEQKKLEALIVFSHYGRGPLFESFEERLKDICDSIWLNGRQQCEEPSLRGNPCILQKHVVNEPGDHSSGVVYISACNCGKIQGSRADPYTVVQANYEFYQTLAANCSICPKAEKYRFPVFEPSINNFKAAEVAIKQMKHLTDTVGSAPTPEIVDDDDLSDGQKSQQTQEDLSLKEHSSEKEDEDAEEVKQVDDDDDDGEEENPNNEIVIKIGEKDDKEAILRQVSTTEYLPSMVQINSPQQLLPQFPSFSLLCYGPSSVYSHNTGLPESIQSGFLSGSNFLLPWEVNVRLEHAQSWAQNYEKNRARRRHGTAPTRDGLNFSLKIFVGYEYECSRGHRFMLNSPQEIMKGGSILRDSGSKVVFSDMPLYFPCPCRNMKSQAAQLMRVHIVTPKAPVNVNIEPKLRPGPKNCGLVFTTGAPEPIKLSQSAYWLLRLPYIYQSDKGTIMPPVEVNIDNLSEYGCLLGGMFSIKEAESCEF